MTADTAATPPPAVRVADDQLGALLIHLQTGDVTRDCAMDLALDLADTRAALRRKTAAAAVLAATIHALRAQRTKTQETAA